MDEHEDYHRLDMLLIRKNEALLNVASYFRWLGKRDDRIGAEARAWAEWAEREAAAESACDREWPT